MRTDHLALIRAVSEFVTTIYRPAVTTKDDNKASTGDLSSLDLIFLDDYEVGTETLEGTTEPAAMKFSRWNLPQPL